MEHWTKYHGFIGFIVGSILVYWFTKLTPRRGIHNRTSFYIENEVPGSVTEDSDEDEDEDDDEGDVAYCPAWART